MWGKPEGNKDYLIMVKLKGFQRKSSVVSYKKNQTEQKEIKG